VVLVQGRGASRFRRRHVAVAAAERVAQVSLGASIARISGTVAGVGVIVGAAFAVLAYADNRYQGKDDYKRDVMLVKESITSLHRARIEDEIFKLELIPDKKKTDYDRAILDRYKAQLRNLDRQKNPDP